MCGQRDFAENYVQELLEKNAILKQQNITDIKWHFIGHLQRNKVKKLLTAIPQIMIHTIDSLELAQEINKHTEKPLNCFIQVNIDNEENKSGIASQDTRSFYNRLKKLPNVNCIGLMCIPEQDNPASFEKMKQLCASINPHLKLSMGMSSDYQAAIRAGATHVRIGTALFGERK